jgi:predicted ribosomally synthesized peptide with SipW-like signal peptide
MKRRVLMSMLLLALAAALIASGTMAWFTDRAEAEPATFEAGTVDIEADGFAHKTPCFDASNWNPGDSSFIGVTFENVGSKKVKLRVKLDKEWEDENLSAKNVEINVHPLLNPWWEKVGDYFYYRFPILGRAVYPGAKIPLLVEVTLDGPKTDNKYQGKTFMVYATAEAVQYSHNAPWSAVAGNDPVQGPQAAVLGESIPKVEELTDAQAIEQMEELQAKYEEIVAGL